MDRISLDGNPYRDKAGCWRPSASTTTMRRRRPRYMESIIRKDLEEVEKQLQKHQSRIHTPPRQDGIPYIFNKLKPYSDVSTARFMVERPDQIRYGYSARPTACGLTDPWVDLNMDHNVLPRISDRHLVEVSPEPFIPKSARKKKKKKKADGSTMCPTFPVISMPTTEYDKKTIYYNDVAKLREQLDARKMLVHKKRKDDADYEKTKQDFVRLELDSFNKMESPRRERMRETYMAYLQNTPGSKKALQECTKKLR